MDPDHKRYSSPPPAASPSAAWHTSLKKSFTKNFLHTEEPVFVQMSSIRRNGSVSMHSLMFQDYLEDDNRFLQFLLAMNDNILMGDIKSDPEGRLCWFVSMPKTKEIYYFGGKFYIASAPIQVTRFPPPKLHGVEQQPQDYWEAERQKQWSRLTPKIRASFTWPGPGETPKADKLAYACLNLEVMEDKPVGVFGASTAVSTLSRSNSLAGKRDAAENPAKLMHDIALDNFCLLIYRVSEVVHYEYGIFPPKRTLHTFSVKENVWVDQPANP